MTRAGTRTTANAYIRVSRRAGRKGESFILPQVQRKRIETWAKAHEVEIVEWWEEIDVSGAKRGRPFFQLALARCERGETGGIVVGKLDRFARSAIDALESIKRLNDAGPRLVSVEDGFDGSAPMGRFAVGILTLIAELELERIKDSWDAAVTSAIRRGVYISTRVPAGYRRDESGRLVPQEPAASAIREGLSPADARCPVREDRRVPRGKRGSPRGQPTLVDERGHQPAQEPRLPWGRHEAAPRLTTRRTSHSSLGPSSTPRRRAAAALKDDPARQRRWPCSADLPAVPAAGTRSRSRARLHKRTGKRYPAYYCSGRYSKGLCPAWAP